jgi:GST-like protein
MIKFYYSGAPNPMKVALMLEECELPHEPIPVDTRKGEQRRAEFLAINPNGKVPAIIVGDATVFDSNAILLYLAEKTGKFLPPKGDKNRGELLSWLMFVATGVGPFLVWICSRTVSANSSSVTLSSCVSTRRTAWTTLRGLSRTTP